MAYQIVGPCHASFNTTDGWDCACEHKHPLKCGALRPGGLALPECATPISPAPSEEMRELALQAAKNRFHEPPIAGQVAFIMGPDGETPINAAGPDASTGECGPSERRVKHDLASAAPAEGPTPDAVEGFASFSARIVPAFKYGGPDFHESAYTQAQLIDAYCQGRHDAAARSSSAPAFDQTEVQCLLSDMNEIHDLHVDWKSGQLATSGERQLLRLYPRVKKLLEASARSATTDINPKEKT